jgi:hypothetical protein
MAVSAVGKEADLTLAEGAGVGGHRFAYHGMADGDSQKVKVALHVDCWFGLRTLMVWILVG